MRIQTTLMATLVTASTSLFATPTIHLAEYQVTNTVNSPFGQFQLIRGRDCRECDAQFVLYIAPANGHTLVNQKSTAYMYPGIYSDPVESTEEIHVHLYQGQCLPKSKFSFVWQNIDIRGGQQKLVKSYSLSFKGADDEGSYNDFDEQFPYESYLVSQIKSGLCQEVGGVDQSFSAHDEYATGTKLVASIQDNIPPIHLTRDPASKKANAPANTNSKNNSKSVFGNWLSQLIREVKQFFSA